LWAWAQGQVVSWWAQAPRSAAWAER
jgi:hypothetical protein